MQEVDSNSGYIGRYAPTPSGLLHKGHASTFKQAKQRAVAKHGKIFLRIEDIDPMRCKPEFEAGILYDLKWLGLDWDEDPRSVQGWVRQSTDLQPYVDTLKLLWEKGLVYPCPYSRKQLRDHPETVAVSNGEWLFPSVLRSDVPDRFDLKLLKTNWRFRVSEGVVIRFRDNRLGNVEYTGAVDFSDFLVWSKSGFPAYELAVVVDDYLSNITEVVRGEDLLLSTARQLLIYQTLDWAIPEFYHCALVCDESGKRLAKSYDSESIQEYRRKGYTPEQIFCESNEN